MKEILARIVALQELEARIRTKVKDRDALAIDVQREEQKLHAVQRDLEMVNKERLEKHKHADAAQLKIEEAEERNRRLQVELNTASNQREYDVLRRSMASNSADIDKWEDEVLEALQHADELSRRKEELETRIAETTERLEQITREVEQQGEQYERDLAQLQGQQDEVRQQIEPTALRAYERIAQHHAGDAIATVRDRTCQGCHTLVTKQTENRLMRGSEIVYCASCGRMLVMDG